MSTYEGFAKWVTGRQSRLCLRGVARLGSPGHVECDLGGANVE